MYVELLLLPTPGHHARYIPVHMLWSDLSLGFVAVHCKAWSKVRIKSMLAIWEYEGGEGVDTGQRLMNAMDKS